ncbi:MAG: TlpA family protein disulfide reductase [Caulobacterales bacterium]|jgi:thiol-disulfide isomerase/thioredoxin|nr:TlpA family protein disulfide reductase [Caulobacterales bacterium]
MAVLYVLFAAASKPEQTAGLMRFAQGEMQRLQTMEVAPPMPTRTLRDATGAETNLQAFSGDVLVVNLWATWCAPCVEEMPTLGALQRRFEGRLRVIPISVDSEGERENAQRLLAELSGGSLPFLIDITRGVLFDAQAAGMPVTIIYDREGREVARLAGGADWDSPESVALLEAVLAGE